MLLAASNLQSTKPRFENLAQLYRSTPLEASGEAAPRTAETCIEANGAPAKAQAVMLLAASNLQSTKPRFENLAPL